MSGFDPSRKLFINRKEVAGVLAMWAVRQSPYVVPDRLPEAVQAMHDALPEELVGWFWATEDELRELVEAICLNDPVIVAWNTPQSGHDASVVFSSRYDRPAPDDDFIDLHALANNICHTLIADQTEFFSDSDGSPQGEKPQALSAQHDSAGRRHRPNTAGGIMTNPEVTQVREGDGADMRTPLEMVMLAAWLGVTPDQVPGAFAVHTCADTMARWRRVGEAALSFATLTKEAPAEPAGEVERLRGLVFESLYHLRVDDAARRYHEKALAAIDGTPKAAQDAGALVEAHAALYPVTSEARQALLNLRAALNQEAPHD